MAFGTQQFKLNMEQKRTYVYTVTIWVYLEIVILCASSSLYKNKHFHCKSYCQQGVKAWIGQKAILNVPKSKQVLHTNSIRNYPKKV